MARSLVVMAAAAAAVLLGVEESTAAPVLGRAAGPAPPSPPRDTGGGPGMGENYTCSLQYSGQFGHSPCARRASFNCPALAHPRLPQA